MVRRFAAALAASCALFVLGAGPLAAEWAQVHKVEDALDVLTAMTAIPEHEAFQQLIRKTYALAIFPDVQKVSIIIGGQRGKGVLIVRDGKGHWTRPLFLSLWGASVGWQIGVQSADIVLFFRTRRSVESVLRGRYTLGIGASVAAGSLGRSAAAATDADMKAEIYSYARARGIFVGLSLEGVSLDVDLDANSTYYGREIDKPADVLLQGSSTSDPPSARALTEAVESWEKNQGGTP
ncbi:MAG TPA: lipid-binding SYLF domain-containing protein [Spirochaetia bacterium]|nr:lipid-binding SYLF domain-containing protein [Spirochaetia bacterium]